MSEDLIISDKEYREIQIITEDDELIVSITDACKFIEEAEKELEKLKKRRQTVQDKVRGSNPEWPYEAKSFNVCGTAEKLEDAGKIQKEEQIIEEQKEVAEGIILPDQVNIQSGVITSLD